MRYVLVALLLSGCKPKLPTDETAFCEVVDDAAAGFDYAEGNDLRLAMLTKARDSKLTRLKAIGWFGKLEKVERSSDGAAGLSLSIPCGTETTLRTSNNFLSDAITRTMIPAGSPLSMKLAGLSVGQRVRFSAEFRNGDNGGMREMSITDRGKFKAPEFLVQFTEIDAQ